MTNNPRCDGMTKVLQAQNCESMHRINTTWPEGLLSGAVGGKLLPYEIHVCSIQHQNDRYKLAILIS